MYKFASILFISIIFSACINPGTPPTTNTIPSPETLAAVGDAYKSEILVLDDIEITYIPDLEEESSSKDNPDIVESEATPNKELTELPLQQ